MNPAPLPGGAQDLRNGGFEALVSVGNDQLHALEAAANQSAQELDPEGGGFRLAQTEPEDLAAAILVDAGGDYCRNRHDAAILADLDVGRIKPEVGPLAVQRPLEERQHAGVDVLAQRRDLRLGDAGHAQRLDQFIDLARRHTLDPGFLDHRRQRLLGGLARFQKSRKVGPLAQLRDLQVERAEPGFQLTTRWPLR
jgi:hypothetical protein